MKKIRILMEKINFVNETCFNSDGFIFGSYVRNYMLPLKLNKNTKNYGTLKYWFNDIENVKLFLDNIENIISKSKKNSILIQIYLSKTHPCIDFSYDSCYYDGNIIYIPEPFTAESFYKYHEDKKCIVSDIIFNMITKYPDIKIKSECIKYKKYKICKSIKLNIKTVVKKINKLKKEQWKLYLKPYYIDIILSQKFISVYFDTDILPYQYKDYIKKIKKEDFLQLK